MKNNEKEMLSAQTPIVVASAVPVAMPVAPNSGAQPVLVAVPIAQQQVSHLQQEVAQCRRCGRSFVSGAKNIPHTSSWFRCEGCEGIKSSDIINSCVIT